MKKITQLNGFTLIELLVVISVIAILAAFLLANMAGVRDRGYDAKLKSNMNQLKTALRMYYNDNQSYPVGASLTTCTSLDTTAYLKNYVDGKLLSETSCDYAGTADTFYACAKLNSDAGDEDKNSAERCGATGTYASGYFCVCSK